MTSREVSHSRKGACGATRSAPAPQAGTHGVSKRRQGTPSGRLRLNACHWSTHAACCSDKWVCSRTDQRQAHARSMAPPLAEVAWPGARHANTRTRAHVHACITSGDARLGRSIRTILSVSPARAAPPAARAHMGRHSCWRLLRRRCVVDPSSSTGRHRADQPRSWRLDGVRYVYGRGRTRPALRRSTICPPRPCWPLAPLGDNSCRSRLAFRGWDSISLRVSLRRPAHATLEPRPRARLQGGTL